MKVAFKQVDVFATSAFSGNPLAVVMDAEGVPDEQLQAIARWTNLSETTFVLPATDPQADYRLRIFTPGGELPFAGHPTLGTAHALLESGWPIKNSGVLIQECGVGNVKIAIGADGTLAFAAPDAVLTPFPAALTSAALAGVAMDPAHDVVAVDMGIRWLLLPMRDAGSVLAFDPVASDLQRLISDAGVSGVMPFAPLPAGEDEQYEVRGLFLEHGSLTEDPVTGSANACLARYFASRGQRQDYRARQGSAIQRHGSVQVRFTDSAIWIGGKCVSRINGTITL